MVKNPILSGHTGYREIIADFQSKIHKKMCECAETESRCDNTRRQMNLCVGASCARDLAILFVKLHVEEKGGSEWRR